MSSIQEIEIYKAIAAVNEEVYSLNKKLDKIINLFNEQRQADIDYIAMETEIELEQED